MGDEDNLPPGWQSFRADSGGGGPSQRNMSSINLPRGDSRRSSGQFQRPASGRARTRSKDATGHELNTDAYTVDANKELAIHKYVRVPEGALDENGVVQVTVSSHWMNTTEIDSVSQRFDATVWIQLSYQINGVTRAQVGDDTKIWKPELTFLNLIHSKEPKMSTRLVEGSTGCTVFVTYQVKGTFAVQFSLASFPIDSQMLRVEAVLWRCPYEAITAYEDDGQPASSILFKGRVEFIQDTSMVYREHFTVGDCWRIVEDVAIWSGVTDEKRRGTRDGVRHSILNISVIVARNPAFFFYNAMLPFFLFVVLSFISLVRDGLSLGDKAQITLPMVLTAAAYKIVMGGYMPTVSYLTLLDSFAPFPSCQLSPTAAGLVSLSSPALCVSPLALSAVLRYILLCFFWLFVVACQNCIVNLLQDSVKLRPFQNASALAITVTWVVIHLLIPIRLVWQQREEESRNVNLKTATAAYDAPPGAPRRLSVGGPQHRDARTCFGGKSRGAYYARRRGCFSNLLSAISRKRIVPLKPVARGPPPKPGSSETVRAEDFHRASDLRASDIGSIDEPLSPKTPHVANGGSSAGLSPALPPAGSGRAGFGSALPSAQSSRPRAATGSRAGNFGASSLSMSMMTAEDADGPGAAHWRDNAVAREV